MSDLHPLDYATPKFRVGQSRYAIASVAMAVAVLLFSAITTFGHELFSPVGGNEKAIRVATTAGILGIVLAVRAMDDPHRKRGLATIGLWLNIAAIVAAWIFLPCLC